MLKKITQLGYLYAKSEEDKRAYYFSNMINLFVIAIFFVILLADLINLASGVGDINYFAANILLEISCLINLFLNAKGKIHVSRIILLIAIFLLLYVLTPILNPIRSEAYFWYPYAPTATSLVVYFLFLKEKEQRFVVFIVLINFIIVLFADILLDYLTISDLPIKKIMMEDYLSYKLNPAMMFIFVNMMMFYAFQRSRKYEESLQLAQEELTKKNKALISSSADKDKFNSIIAHDLRGPFGSLNTMTQLMKDEPTILDPSNREKFVTMLNESTTQVNKLLENLLEWSQVQTGGLLFSPENTNLETLIKEAVSMFEGIASEKEIILTEHYENVQEAVLDIHMIRSILRNLISNAIKFTPTKGHVDIHAEKEEGNITITVSDSGQGMSNERKEKLFKLDEKYSTPGTSNEKGSGLGLLIVKEFIDKHGGMIHVESELSNGSSFSVQIPV
ncbi:MAG: HAMP domain-containing histidine kinase [Reichenbachiella sp.]